MESNRFEDSFRNAFDGAEILPSAAVWKNIELDLAKESGGQLKRNLLMFQLLAAASVAFALGVPAVYYLTKPTTQYDLSKETLSGQHSTSLPSATESATDQKVTSEDFIKKKNIAEEATGQNAKLISNRENIAPNQSLVTQSENPLSYKITRKGLSALVETKRPVLILPKEERSEPDAGMVLLARLKDEEKKYQNEEKNKTAHENVWASVGFGAGSYKPNRQVMVVNGATPSESTGESYSVGFNVAGKVSKRLVVQGGVAYLAQNANFTSTGSSNGTATLSEYARPATFNSFVGVSPYMVNSSMQFVSVPVQAGFIVIDRAFGVQLTGGIATDLFVSNKLSPENDSYQQVTQAAGKDSPYRTVNFSGLLGTELSYRIADHYRISLNPGLRYALHSIYKEGVAAEIAPVTFDVSLRFRYIFK